MSPLTILVTGATGFIGAALVPRLLERGHRVLAAVRKPLAMSWPDVDAVVTGDIGPDTDWSASLEGVDVIVHLAARAHVVDERTTEALQVYRSINTLATVRLADAAAGAGVRRFIFMSSARVHGSRTTDRPFVETSPLAADDPYGRSKAEAERALIGIAESTRLEVVVLRPPLVYGPGARGNFARLARLVARGMPLPLGSVHNRRSLIFLGNMVDIVNHCLEHPAAANQTFLVSDGEDVSTAELIRRIARAFGRPPRLLPVPLSLLRLGGTITGRSADVARLLDDFVVDSSRVRATLDWVPPFSLNEGLARTAKRIEADMHPGM